MLLLVKYTPPWVFFTFLNCAHGTKSRNAPHMLSNLSLFGICRNLSSAAKQGSLVLSRLSIRWNIFEKTVLRFSICSCGSISNYVTGWNTIWKDVSYLNSTVLAFPSIISLLGVTHICLHKQCVVLRFFPTPYLWKSFKIFYKSPWFSFISLNFCLTLLTYWRPKLLSDRNLPIDLHRKPIECFLYDGNFDIYWVKTSHKNFLHQNTKTMLYLLRWIYVTPKKKLYKDNSKIWQMQF